MCQYPIKILNRSLTYSPLVTPKFVEVPCGHCSECVHSQQNEWFIRISSEIEHSKISFFYTLTFNEKYIPKFVPKDFPSVSLNCFDYRYIKLFNDRLRRYLFRSGFDRFSFRFMIVSEYGKHTQRPHHHLFLACRKNISPKLMTEFVEKAWTFGFVSPNSPLTSFDGADRSKFSVIRSSRGGAFYVSKYISKDIDFYRIPFIKTFLDRRLPDYKKHYEEIKPFLPRHWQSHGFGIDIVSCPDTWTDLLTNGVNMSFTDKTGKYHHVVLPLSRYLKDKILYETTHYSEVISRSDLDRINKIRYEHRQNPNIPVTESFSDLVSSHSHTYRTLTDYGREYFLSSYLVKCTDLAKRFENVMSKSDLSNIMPDFKEVRNTFFNKLGNYSLFDLAQFALVYHGYTNDCDIWEKLKDFYVFPPFSFDFHTSLDTFLNSATDVFCLRSQFVGSWFGTVSSDEHNVTFDSYPAFRNFATCLKLFFDCKNKINSAKAHKDIELRQAIKHLKEYGIHRNINLNF